MLSRQSMAASGTFDGESGLRKAHLVAAGLTLEIALYVVLGFGALLLRVAGLGTRPMDTSEATQALASWQVIAGLPVQATIHSPLLFTGNAIIFTLLAASDAWARFLPAFFGTILALSPALFRPWLGRTGALLATVFLTFSPTAMYYSRFLGGETIVLACALFVLAGFLHYARTHRTQYSHLAVVALALMLTAGRAAYTVGFIAFTFVVLLWLGRTRLTRGAWLQLVNLREVASQPGLIRSLVVLFVLTLVLIGTLLLLHFPGLGHVFDLFPTWLAQVGPAIGGLPWYHHLVLLLIYEPLILVFGLVGIVLTLADRSVVRAFLMYWTIIALYAYTLFGGKSSADVLIPLVPMALLAGWVAGQIVDALLSHGNWEVEGIFLAIAAVVTVYVFLQIASFGQTGQFPYIWLAIAGLILTTLLFAGYLIWVGSDSALRAVGTSFMIALLLFTIGATWRLNYITLDDPVEIIEPHPTYVGIRDLTAAIDRLSTWRAGDQHELPIELVALNEPILDWYLRDFRALRHVDKVVNGTETRLLITSEQQASSSIPTAYRGSRFGIRSYWMPTGLNTQEWINWWLYRKSDIPATIEYVVLWAKNDGAPGTNLDD